MNNSLSYSKILLSLDKSIMFKDLNITFNLNIDLWKNLQKLGHKFLALNFPLINYDFCLLQHLLSVSKYIFGI